MQETIKGYNGEIDSIKLVVEKLVTKQNSSVFDKLCNMVNNLFNRMTNYNASELTQDDIRELIASFKRLLEISITLYNYREYLIAVVNQNISELESLQTNGQTQDRQNEENQVATSPAINNVEEVNPENLNSVVSLNLTNNDQKNAA
ncbi:MAG: hypothetical protein K2G03_04885 [Bacilli bacterium]|nr:hypothetical protein [Bacilli bacterium]